MPDPKDDKNKNKNAPPNDPQPPIEAAVGEALFGDVNLKKVGGDYYFWNPLHEIKEDGITVSAKKIELFFVPVERRMREKKSPGDADQYYYIGFSTKPMMVKNLDGEWKLAPPKSHIWVDERHALKALASFLPKFMDTAGSQTNDPNRAADKTKPVAITVVHVVPKEKKPVKGTNRTVWAMDVEAGVINLYTPKGELLNKGHEGLPLLPPATKVEPEEEDGEATPF